MNSKTTVIILILVMLLAGALFTKIFLIDDENGIDSVSAIEIKNINVNRSSQSGQRFTGGDFSVPPTFPPTEDTCDDGCWVTFYIEVQDPINTIIGQPNTWIYVQNSDAVDRFEISNWNFFDNQYSLETLNHLPCILDFDGQGWSGSCDSMAILNHTGKFFGIRAFKGDNPDPVALKHHTDDSNLPVGNAGEGFVNIPLFGPYVINNTGAVAFTPQHDIRGDGSLLTIQGDVEVELTLSGNVDNAYLFIEKIGETHDIIGFEQSVEDELKWSMVWNSNQDPYRGYRWDLSIKYIPDQSYGENIFAKGLETDQEVEILSVTIPDSPPINPGNQCNYICTNWSDCINNSQTRTCTSDVGGSECPIYQETNDCEDLVDDETTTDPEDIFIAPKVFMTIPKQGDEVYGTITLTAKATGTFDTLEFYWKNDSQNDMLIGSGYASLADSTIYEKSWDTAQTPDGDYLVYARVKGQNGEYYAISNEISVSIDNSEIDIPSSTNDQPTESTDTDSDNVPDLIEIELGTNPRNPDTDEDNINDGVEILDNKNPSGIGSLDELVESGRVSQTRIAEIIARLKRLAFEEPKEKGTLDEKNLKILRIENFIPFIGQNQIIFTGIGPPNTYFTLFIYTTPVVVTTRTDSSGNFKYILDKNLADGSHEVYVTITDDTGRIKKKSSPFTFFVRDARAVSEEEYYRGDVDVEPESRYAIGSYLLIAIVVVAGALVVLVTTYFRAKKKQQNI